MNTENEANIDRIIANYLAEKSTEEELVFFEKWLKDSETNRIYFLQLQNLWENSDAKFDVTGQQTQNAYKKVQRRILVTESKPLFWRYFQRIASILLLPLLIGSFYLGRNLPEGKSGYNGIVYNEIYAAFGTRSTMKLSDGSQVWLNSGSSLKYPIQFGTGVRNVYLNGEAYFEVQSDVKNPFIVQTPSLSVKATGTKFNIQAFRSNKKTQVTLVSGKLTVSKTEEDNTNEVLAKLKSNQHLVFDSITGLVNVQQEDVYKYIAWKDGKLMFRNERMVDVVEKISQLYNVEIEIKDKSLQEYRYWATFQDETVSEIMKLLKVSAPLNYKEMKRNTAPDGTFLKKKYIIYSLGDKENK